MNKNENTTCLNCTECKRFLNIDVSIYEKIQKECPCRDCLVRGICDVGCEDYLKVIKSAWRMAWY